MEVSFCPDSGVDVSHLLATVLFDDACLSAEGSGG